MNNDRREIALADEIQRLKPVAARRAHAGTVMIVTQTHCVWGGMEWWVHHFGHWLQQRGWRVTAGLAKGRRYSNDAEYRAAHPHLEPFVMDGRAETESARVEAVARAIRGASPDVVIPIGIGATLPAVRKLKREGFDTRLVVPVFSAWNEGLANILDEWDAIDLVVPNARLFEIFLKREVTDPNRVVYVRQGVPPARTHSRHDAPGLRVGFIGRLEEVSKRVLDLVPLAGHLENSGIELHVFGDGPDRDALQKGLQGRAIMHGYMPTDRLYEEAYPQLDVILLFSPTEGSPNVLYEAMQHGVVPVSSRFLGLAAEGTVRHEDNALTFEVGDSAGAARLLIRLQNDRALLRRLAANAVETVRTFTHVEMYRTWEELLTRVKERPPVTPDRDVVPAPAGRLDRILPARIANAVRRWAGTPGEAASGWHEWPGSQPAEATTLNRVRYGLAAIDAQGRSA
jgi:glycosyltransferase involved in cell wall biosynthesis